MKDYLLLFTKDEKLKRNINSFEYYEDEVKSTTSGEKSLVFKMKEQIIDIEMGDKIGVFLEGKFDLFIVDQIESETYYSTDIKVTCLHDFYSIQEQKAITQYHSENATLRQAITEILKGTEYVLGTCPERAIKPIGPYLYKNPLWCIQDIVSNFNVEIDYSIELNENRNRIHRKVLNVVNSLGSDTGIRCSTDLNVSKIKKVQKKKFYTVMYGCGAEYQKDLVKYKHDFKDAVWTTPDNPVNKPRGQEFVEDKEAISKYGRKIGIYEDGRIKDPELLLKKTWEALRQNNRPFVSYELDIEELKTEDGYEHLNFKLGDIIILQNTIDNSRAKFRIVEDYKSVRDKNKRKIVVGEQIRGIFSGGDSSNTDGTEGPGGSVIEPGYDGDAEPPNIEEIIPDTLPEIPILTAKGLWKDVQLSWSYENKIYYDYEVYASKVKGFEPTIFHMIYSGKASAFLHEAGANETWYYRVRAVNSFGNATQFSEEVGVHTTKVNDGTQYFERAAIKDALIEQLRLDRGWIGQLNATYLDIKGNFSVTDGNGKRTIDIDSFGNVNLDVASMKIKGESAASKADVQLTADNLTLKFEQQGDNLLLNSKPYKSSYGVKPWQAQHYNFNFPQGWYFRISNHKWTGYEDCLEIYTPEISTQPDGSNYAEIGMIQTIETVVGQKYRLTGWISGHRSNKYVWVRGSSANEWEVIATTGTIGHYLGGGSADDHRNWFKIDLTFTAQRTSTLINIGIKEGVDIGDSLGKTSCHLWAKQLKVVAGVNGNPVWTANPTELQTGIMRAGVNGFEVIHKNGSKTNLNSQALDFYDSQGNMYSSINSGRFTFEDKSGNPLGAVGRNTWAGSGRALTEMVATYGNTVGLGAKYSPSSNTFTVPLLVSGVDMATTNGYGVRQGINMHGYVNMGGNTQRFYPSIDMHESYSSIIFANSSEDLCIYGNAGIRLGVRHADGNWNIVRITNTGTNSPRGSLDIYTHLNMNGWTIKNSRSVMTLDSNSAYSRSRIKDIKDSYGVMSCTDGDIRYSDRETHTVTKTLDGKLECYVELPYYLAENLENNYHVNISKRSFGDYYVKEVNPYYFILESDREDFSFTFEVVGKLIEKPSGFSIIANRSLIDNEEPENSAPVIEDDIIDKKEYWRLYAK